jgi:glycerophosphoryl diester phosphodiesterase
VTRPRTGFPYLDAGLDQPGAVLAIAHRGGAYHPQLEGLENTLTAFEHAVELGYRYLETDVHTTRDGVLMAFHDAALDRVTDSAGPLADMDANEVRAVIVGEREKIPTMASLFERFPEACFNIDLKSSAAVGPLADLVIATRAYDRVCVGSFSERRLRRFRALVGPRVATSCSPSAIAVRRFLRGRRLVSTLAGPAAALQVPHRRGRLRVVTAEFVARAHAAGLPVHVWTIDDPAEMHELLDLGVDGLMSDRTDVLRAVLMERGQWLGLTR